MRKALTHLLSSIIGTSLIFAIILIFADVAWRVFGTLRPATAWMVVERVFVDDTIETSSPAMQVDRTVLEPFRGYWIVEVEHKFAGGFYSVCAASGKNLYEPGERLPDSITLDWWTWPTKCRPKHGTYRVVTNWQIVSDNYPDKQLSFISNEFTILKNQSPVR